MKIKIREKILGIASYIIVITLSAAILIPIVWTALVSIKTKSAIFSSVPLWWGFIFENNYYRPFIKEGYFRLMSNSIFTAIGCIVVSIPLSYLAAYAFSRFKIFGAPTMYFWMLTCRMGPEAVFIVPYYLLINRLGLYDHTLGLILVFSLFNIPFAVWLMKSGIDSIPMAVEEAALVDGASIKDILFRIILPLSAPTIAASSIMVFIFSWNEYLLASVLTGSNARTITVGMAAFITTVGIRWGEMAAVTMTSLIPTIVTVAILQKYIISGLTMGAVKG
jgi:multiple sugar transport system permease protein